ncbi:hypothetical protein FE257_005973 [Aspergillus nanangensis]|uniref:C2H2-type domain-containing protein n=1 Tax=Aspergillus nanangensis TaxID=2582783 RepID=A0AAD4GV01_ASPNN|nr:hypothetical protein FE257_005973 [Aspergillus nanangensis]
MFMSPSRKDLITSTPFVNYQDSVCIQDDQYLPDFSSQEVPLQFIDQPQPSQYTQQRLESPFQYHPDLQFVSPPSSVPSTPNSSSPSPPSSFSHLHGTPAVTTDYSAVFDGSNSFEAPSMTPASSYNPSIHISQSASPPSSQQFIQPQYPQQYIFNTPMLAQQRVANNHGWDNNVQLLSPARIQNNISQYSPELLQQKTSPSLSSSKSAPAGSSYQRSNGAAFSKPLPTPEQTPFQQSFMATPYQAFDDATQADADLAIRRAVMEQKQQQQQQQQQQQNHHRHHHQSSDHSLAPSVSSVSHHNSPVTPQTNFEELDDTTKAIVNGEQRFSEIDRWMDDYLHFDDSEYNNPNGNNMSMGVPKLNRTISDIYQDELYNPAMMSASQVSKPPTNQQQQNLLTPYRNVFADRLQAANQGHLSARSQSPVVTMNRDRSPFRQGSPLAADLGNSGLQQPQMATTSMPGPQATMGQATGDPKTMSPKDALLDFDEGEEGAMPLFAPNQADFNLGDTMGLRRESSSSFQPSQNFASMDSFPAQYATQTGGVPQQYHFAQQQQSRQQPVQTQQNGMLHQTPDFPASLPTFESTGSDILPSTEMPTHQAQINMPIQSVHEEIMRPENTTSDGGTYTCTYHGCTQRFETPAKLQKHKREAHRQTTPGGHLVGRDTASRNSQAGPHRCERINPSTGKPCNSIFSRPYDLTRHEDTIHNARKQKVRCSLCTEEKTFSRNDALTRHMRVVHPEVDWPGKQRRRGRE